MEFWLDKSKIAYTTKPIGTASCALDVWEQNNLGGSPFKYSASFLSDIDARIYLTAKYPDAVENMVVENMVMEKPTNGHEEVASDPALPRPTPPHDLRDEDAWRKYRLDSRRYRASDSEALRDSEALQKG
jgi:hypothetical protein